jgi:SAM-dependent methyltransferase
MSTVKSEVRRLLEHPLTRGVGLDDPRLYGLRRQVLQSKPFLRRLYGDWYTLLLKTMPAGPGAVLELGSGAGFLREVLPGVQTSDILGAPGVDVLMDGVQLAVRGGALRGVAMVDVLHHLPDCRRFFREAARCVRPGGAIVAIEPWVTAWSRFIYGRFHHEPFRPEALEWEFPATGPLSSANQALPWIIAQRDRKRFEAEFPAWRVELVQPIMPFRYLASGGIGLRNLAPAWSYPLVAALERMVQPLGRFLAMFALIVIRRVEPSAGQR